MIDQVLDSRRNFRKRATPHTFPGTSCFLMGAQHAGPFFGVSCGARKRTRQASKMQAWLCPLDYRLSG